MAGMKRAAAVLLALLTAVLAGSTGPFRESTAEPRAIAALVQLPAAEALSTEAAEKAESVSAQQNRPEAPAPEAEAADAADTAQTASARAANANVQETALKAITLPDIPEGAPAPAQVKCLPDSGRVCLTFDDGYSEAAIETILSCLREYGVHCTFFIIGSCLKLYPALWRQAAEEGHEIAYHTMRHRNLTLCSNAQIVDDINAWNETAARVLGRGCRIPMIARAPGGSANVRVRRLFASLHYTLIYWSSDTFTGVYRHNHSGAGTRAAAYILRHTAAGAISLQHFNAYDAASVSQYIGELSARFRLGTVGEALAETQARAQRQALTSALKQHEAQPKRCGVY